MKLKPHPYADLFPMMGDEEFKAFSEDILIEGLRHSIVLFEGKILDGRNRYKACMKFNKNPRVKQFKGDAGAALNFVISCNLKRRHLTDNQRAMVAASISTARRGSNQHTSNEASSVPESKAAEMLNVSKAGIQRAKKVRRDGSPDLVGAVTAGKIGVGPASKIADLPKAEQSEVVAKGPKAVAEKVKEMGQKAEKPKKPKQGFVPFQDCDGEGIVATAISIMDRINPNDKFREYAFNRMIEYCEKKLDRKPSGKPDALSVINDAILLLKRIRQDDPGKPDAIKELTRFINSMIAIVGES